MDELKSLIKAKNYLVKPYAWAKSSKDSSIIWSTSILTKAIKIVPNVRLERKLDIMKPYLDLSCVYVYHVFTYSYDAVEILL